MCKAISVLLSFAFLDSFIIFMSLVFAYFYFLFSACLLSPVFSSFFRCCFNPNSVPPSPTARVGLLLEIGCSLSLQRAMLKLQPGPARSVPSIIFLTSALLSKSECPYGVDGPFSEEFGFNSERHDNSDTGYDCHVSCFCEHI
jgi:hypothetical protein